MYSLPRVLGINIKTETNKTWYSSNKRKKNRKETIEEK
jgi:hypothetical protein